MKQLKIVVLAKQVPDTRNVGKDAMKEDGTVNRAALPAIFNPEDLNALEQALSLKERYGATVTVLTMGPSRAADVIREAIKPSTATPRKWGRKLQKSSGFRRLPTPRR